MTDAAGGTPSAQPLTRLLVVGIDAGDPDLIREGVEAGRLPNLAALLGRGVSGPTTNPPGLYVGAVWPSFYTGVSPARHGRHCYCQLRSGGYDTPRFRPRDLRHEPFWEALARAGRRLAVLDVPKTFVSETLDGLQLCDWGTHDPEGEIQSHPPGLAEEVVARFGSDPVGRCDRKDRDGRGFAELRDGLVRRAGQRAELARHYLARGGWDLFLVVFSETHCVGHQCWHLHDPSHPLHDPALRRALGDPVADVYAAVDRGLGAILDRIGADTTVLVLASHGMGPHYDGTFLLPEILRRLQDPPSSALRRGGGELLAAAWNGLPDRLREALAGLRDRVRAPLADALPSTEMQGARRCFPVPNNDVYGAIRLNLVGREPHGRLRAGGEAEAFCSWLSQELLALARVGDGAPVIKRVLRTADLYRGERLDDLPDLLVEWDRSRPITAIESPRTGRIEGRFGGTRTGDHREAGSWVAAGPGIAPGRVAEAVSVVDFAPTLGALLGVPLPGLDGMPIPELAASRRT
jgi:predicted AlkP superfamily phosphohydrolase/phosphomutase